MYLTYLLLAATVLVSVLAFQDESLKRRLMFNPHDVVHYNKWYRSFTHAFIHADYFHLGFNMYVLYAFGVQYTQELYPPQMYVNVPYSLEPTLVHDFGARGYLYFGLLYLGGILFSTLIAIRRHRDNPGYNSLGASGAVMAVVFAYIILNPNAQLGLIFLPIHVPAYIFGPILLGIEYYMSKRGRTGIAHDAHFAGAVFGIIFITLIDYHYLLDFFKQLTS